MDSGYGSVTELSEVLGTGKEVLRKSLKNFRVLYGSLTKLTEVPCGYMDVVPAPVSTSQHLQSVGYHVYSPVFILFSGYVPYKGRARAWDVVPVPLWHGRAELPEVSGTGMKVIEDSQKFRVRVETPSRTYRTSLWGNTGARTPGMIRFVCTLRNTTLGSMLRFGAGELMVATSNISTPLAPLLIY